MAVKLTASHGTDHWPKGVFVPFIPSWRAATLARSVPPSSAARPLKAFQACPGLAQGQSFPSRQLPEGARVAAERGTPPRGGELPRWPEVEVGVGEIRECELGAESQPRST